MIHSQFEQEKNKVDGYVFAQALKHYICWAKKNKTDGNPFEQSFKALHDWVGKEQEG